MNPSKGLQSSANGRHWPCIEWVDGLHRGTPGSGWLSAHTDPLTSPPQARGWSTTSSRLVLLSPWGCWSTISSGLQSPEGKAVKCLCIKNWCKKRTVTSLQTAAQIMHRYRRKEIQNKFRNDANDHYRRRFCSTSSPFSCEPSPH